MDQIYIPKNRSGYNIGSYVVVKPLEIKKDVEKPYFYNIKSIEPVKLEILNEIMKIIDKNLDNIKNIIITGSFLERGFNFKDIDIIIYKEKVDAGYVKEIIEDRTGIRAHIVLLNNKKKQNLNR